jgi:hypothetical protein
LVKLDFDVNFLNEISSNDVVGGGKYETSGGHISGTSYSGCKAAKGGPTTTTIEQNIANGWQMHWAKVEGLKYLYDDTCHADSHLAAVSAEK